MDKILSLQKDILQDNRNYEKIKALVLHTIKIMHAEKR